MTANSNTDWRHVLADACQRQSQAAVARRLGVSAALVNQVLKGAYNGDLMRIERLVTAYLTDATVTCPYFQHAIPLADCLKHQARPLKYATASPQKIAIYRACRGGCEYFHSNTEE